MNRGQAQCRADNRRREDDHRKPCLPALADLQAALGERQTAELGDHLGQALGDALQEQHVTPRDAERPQAIPEWAALAGDGEEIDAEARPQAEIGDDAIFDPRTRRHHSFDQGDILGPQHVFRRFLCADHLQSQSGEKLVDIAGAGLDDQDVAHLDEFLAHGAEDAPLVADQPDDDGVPTGR